ASRNHRTMRLSQFANPDMRRTGVGFEAAAVATFTRETSYTEEVPEMPGEVIPLREHRQEEVDEIRRAHRAHRPSDGCDCAVRLSALEGVAIADVTVSEGLLEAALDVVLSRASRLQAMID